MSEELKPCPFCGQRPSYETAEGVWKEHHIITCQNIAERCVGCSCKPMWYASKIKAIEAWNRRPAEAELATLREENARLKALAEWTPIDEQHLPKVGDEIMRFNGIDLTHVYAVFAEPNSYAHCLARGDTHFRPINAPPAVKP